MCREERMFPASFTITEVSQYVITATVASINLVEKKKCVYKVRSLRIEILACVHATLLHFNMQLCICLLQQGLHHKREVPPVTEAGVHMP